MKDANFFDCLFHILILSEWIAWMTFGLYHRKILMSILVDLN
jgi:hypothetical protein